MITKDGYVTMAELKAIDTEKWDERFMQIAEAVAKWSSCLRPNRQMGSVVVRDKRILTTGYNGAVSGIENCLERGECLRDKRGIESGKMQEICFAVHAEQNAVIQAAKIGVSVDGATLYVTHQPCAICAKIIINSGIKRIVYKNPYPDEFSIAILKEAGVEVVKLKEA